MLIGQYNDHPSQCDRPFLAIPTTGRQELVALLTLSESQGRGAARTTDCVICEQAC